MTFFSDLLIGNSYACFSSLSCTGMALVVCSYPNCNINVLELLYISILMIGLESVMDKSIGCFLPQKVMSVVLAKYFLSMMVQV
jgi:hypothetical protein